MPELDLASDDRSPADRVSVTVHLDPTDWSDHLAAETARGLSDAPPWIPPVWFYDEVGSKLFDQITRLAEYYPTEAERAILAAHATDIARITSATRVIELGSGTSDKTMLLLDALATHGSLRVVVPFDVSEAVLRSAARTIAATYPDVRVDAVVGDFGRHLDRVSTGDATLLAFLGSTIGNLDPVQRGSFLDGAARALQPGDWFLLGTDLVKPVDRLFAAYDDSSGVTAEFNLNALDVMNRELGGDFYRERFTHRAHWDPEHERIEMHLVSTVDQVVTLDGLVAPGDSDATNGLTLRLRAGEHLRTEISTKFHASGVAAELVDAGFEPTAAWTDPAGDFLLTLALRP
ncbi:MAG TPA: L-histidine N(alpha)-methyltransferase [Microthrixaceae bacterium]|nr:L-histidine N(alpha)-methyltransferase [Microthrixaceae bacterium]